MNREQAKALLENADILRHFADGGDLGFRLFDYRGVLVKTVPVDSLNLSGISKVSTHYVMVKARLRWDANLQCYERVRRCWTETIDENEIIPRGEKND